MGFVSEIKEIIEETHDKIPMPIRIEYKRAENLNMGHVYTRQLCHLYAKYWSMI